MTKHQTVGQRRRGEGKKREEEGKKEGGCEYDEC